MIANTLLMLLGFSFDCHGRWWHTTILPFWGGIGCPVWAEWTCAAAGCAEGSTPWTCISNWKGDEIPLYMIEISTGYHYQDICSGTCEEYHASNYQAGVSLAPLTVSVEDRVAPIRTGYDAWYGNVTVYRSHNSTCNGGEYFLHATGWGDVVFLYYTAYDDLPDMLDPSGYELINRKNQSYVMWDNNCSGYTPPKWTPSYLGDQGGAGTCSFVCVDCVACCISNGLPSEVDAVWECGAKWKRCDGVGGFVLASNTNGHIINTQQLYVYPYILETIPCCTHGPYCSDGNLVAGTDTDYKGPCCVTATFNNLTLPADSFCYYGPIDKNPSLGTHVVRYKNNGGATWHSDPYGCIAPFPTEISITCTQRTISATCHNSVYTVLVYGSDYIWTDYGYYPRTVVFKKVVELENTNWYWYEYCWKITPEDFDSLFSDIEFSPEDSLNLDFGYSADFNAATVSLALLEIDYNECANVPHVNPFIEVEYWELRFTPVEQRVLYYDENYWEVDGSGCRVGPAQKRQMVPIIPGAQWVMNDSINYPVTFQFQGDTYARGSIMMGEPPADEDSVTISDGQGGHSPVVFEFDEGVGSTGTIQLTGLPSDGNTITMDDGGNDSVIFEFDSGIAATGTVTLAANPADGDMVIINDGVNTAVAFEFDDDASVLAGAVTVTIGGNKEATIANLIIAVNAAAIDITASASAPADNVCNLENDATGTRTNTTMLGYGTDVAVDGMTGGQEGGDNIAGGNVGAPIKWTVEETMAALIFIINNKTKIDITAAESAPPDDSCTLENSHKCAASNQTVTKSGANITVAGMTGGSDGGGACSGGEDVCMAVGWGIAESMSNLIDTINVAGGLDITATLMSSGLCRLKNEHTGTDGNVDITETGDSMTVSGMEGGATGAAVPDCVEGIEVIADDVLQLEAIHDKINEMFGVDRACPGGEPNTEFYMRAWAHDPEETELAVLELLLLGNDSQSAWSTDLSTAMLGGITLVTFDDDELLITNVVDLSSCGNGGAADIMNAGTMKIGKSWHFPDRKFTYDDTTINVDDETVFVVSDGVTANVFEFDNDDSITAGNVRIEIGLTSKETMANIIVAINGSGLDLEAVPSDPPDENCTIWQGEGADRQQIGSMSFSSDWYELDPDDPTGEGVVVTLDKRGVIGEYWYQDEFPVAVWVWQDMRRVDGYIVQLLYDLCYMGGLHYSFCYPGWGGEHTSAFSCVVNDEWQHCGYKDGTVWSLTPYYIDRTV